jgi:hypothetical protein
MAYEYIKRTYGVDPKVSQRITVDGRPGTITRPLGDTQYLRVRFDGMKHSVNAHPTWKVDYAPATQPHPNRRNPLSDEEAIEFRRDLVRKVKAGEMSLEAAQYYARTLAPMGYAEPYLGFAGMTASEMCGEE